MKFAFYLTLFVISHASELDPFSEEFIDIINSKQSTWRAGRNFQVESLSQLHGLFGALRTDNKTLPIKSHDTDPRETLPIFFDARVQWGDCPSIGEIRDQASCASCWAFGAVEAMTDRICIHSKGEKQLSVSAEDLLSCCGLMCGLGCYGGFADSAWTYWTETGIVTGGQYGTNDGCKPYSLAPCSHYNEYSSKPACGDVLTPICVSSCNEPSMSYKSELTFGESAYYVLSDQDQIKMEIMTNGPVEATFDVYADFLYYKSGVYQNVEGAQLGGHAVKILGWGLEGDTPYWLAANSWGEDWGDNGYFKILRGVNHIGIESDVVAGKPKL